MRRWSWLMPAVVMVLMVAGLYQFSAWARPDWLRADLRRELSAAGLTVGLATPEEAQRLLGPPGKVTTEVLATVYEYPSAGLLFRFERASGRLIWYESTSPARPTARGIGPGAGLAEVRRAYGEPDGTDHFRSGSRVRYRFGRAYTLEFWLDPAARVERIVFYST